MLTICIYVYSYIERDPFIYLFMYHAYTGLVLYHRKIAAEISINLAPLGVLNAIGFFDAGSQEIALPKGILEPHGVHNAVVNII